MFQRIAGLVVTVAGVIVALVIGFWALIFLGLVAVVAAVVYALRSRLMRNGGPRSEPGGEVIEGDYVVLDDSGKAEGDEKERRHP